MVLLQKEKTDINCSLKKYPPPSNPFLRTKQTGIWLEVPASWSPLSILVIGETPQMETFNSSMQPLDFSFHADHAYSVQDKIFPHYYIYDTMVQFSQ